MIIAQCTCCLPEELGFETIMVNCNPETVSTDYDTADRLFYFEPLTIEVYCFIIELKNQGVVVHSAGGAPLKLHGSAGSEGVKILVHP